MAKPENAYLEQLTVAFGKKRAKKIIQQIGELKARNPKKVYSFVFAEDGSFQAISKDTEPEEEEEGDDDDTTN